MRCGLLPEFYDYYWCYCSVITAIFLHQSLSKADGLLLQRKPEYRPRRTYIRRAQNTRSTYNNLSAEMSSGSDDIDSTASHTVPPRLSFVHVVLMALTELVMP